MTFYHDQKHNVLVYPNQNPFVLQNLPEAKLIGRTHFAVPFTLTNAQVLRYFNHPVPTVMDGYDWPHAPGIKPYESQKTTSNFVVLHRRAFVLSDMGVGKTLAVLWAADWLMQQYPKGECCALIVAPLSTLQRVWGDAIFKNFLSRRSFEILHGTPSQRIAALARKADFYVANYEGVSVGAHVRNRLELDGFSQLLAERSDIRIAIVDEASAYKSASTKRHRISRLVFGKKEYLWALSGTPTPNSPVDAYGLAKLVNNAYGKSESTFRSESMIKVSQFVWVPQRDGYAKARQLLSPSIRFDIRDVWDGPELTTQQREVELTDQQKKLIADLKRDLQITIKSGEPITAVNEAALRTKFIQIVLGAVYDSDHKAHLTDASPRLNELKAVIEQAPGKLLIFVPLTSVVNVLYKELGQIKDKAGKVIQEGWSRAIVNGETSQKERAAIFEQFQRSPESAPRLLIADPGTMAHGLDLWQAQTVVWYGPSDKTELYLQANKRAHRPGQKHPVTIVEIIATPLEREIFRRLETNTSLQGALLDMVRKGEF